MTLHISTIEPVGGHGGMNYYNSGLGLGLLDAGYPSTLYTSTETVEETVNGFVIDKCFVNVFGATNKFFRFFKYIVGVFHAIRDIKRNGRRFAHLHFFQYGILEFITCILIRIFGLVIIATIHDVESFASGKSRVFQRCILFSCKHFIVHNKFSKSELLSSLSVVGIKRHIDVIPHGNYKSYIQECCKAKSRILLNLNEESKVLLFFGQIKEVKGLDVLLDALSIVKRRRSDVVLVIAGKTWKTDFSKYDNTIQELGLKADVIQHIHYIPDSDVGAYYSAADLVLLPYKKIYQSGVLLMSMSYAKPVIASDLPPMKEILVDKENGFLFESENSNSLADVIISALSSDLSRIGDRAKDTMDGEFSWESVAKKHIEVYKRYAY